MKPFRKALAVLALGAASTAAWFGVTSLVQNVQFANAAQEVEATRQQLAGVGELSKIYRGVAKAVEPSVVKIDVMKTVRGNQFFPDRNGDGEPDMPEQEMLQMGEGSGVIVESNGKDAFVLTNNHVAGGASTLRVTLADGRIVSDAKVIGTDPKSDLAVIRIPADRVIPAKWGNSDELEKGDIIFAFGSPFGYVGSMTHGIVSALNRRARIIEGPFSYENFIQVDAPINPGNSGGPLANLRGEVVGINTAIASRNGVFNGIGFAIPTSLAKPVYEQLRDKGKVVRGWIGVEIGDVADLPDAAKDLGFDGTTGVIVGRPVPDAPSAGKLRAGDIITSIDGKSIDNMDQLRRTVAATTPGTDLKLSVFREGKSLEVPITVSEQPSDLLARAVRTAVAPVPSDATGISVQDLGVRLTTPSAATLQRLQLGDVKGALVSGVAMNSVAARAGVRTGDVITRIGDDTIESAEQAVETLAKHELAQGVRLYLTNKSGERFVFIGGR